MLKEKLRCKYTDLGWLEFLKSIPAAEYTIGQLTREYFFLMRPTVSHLKTTGINERKYANTCSIIIDCEVRL